MTTECKCPVHHAVGRGTSNRDWWPNQLRLDLLHQHPSKSTPMGEDFDYRKELRSLDYAALKKDLAALMISWTDLFILTGNVDLETMGIKTFGFAGQLSPSFQRNRHRA